MKSVVLFLFLCIFYSSLYAQENWEKVINETQSFYRHLEIIDNNVIMFGTRGDSRILNLNTYEIIFEEKLSNDVLPSYHKKDKNLYISFISNSNDNSRIVKYDKNLNVLEEFPFSDPNSVINNFNYINGEYYFSSTNLFSGENKLITCDSSFNNFNQYDLFKNEFTYYIYFIDENLNKIFVSTKDGNIYTHSVDGNLNKIDEVESFLYSEPRTISFNDDNILVSFANGKILTSHNNGENWDMKSDLPVTNFRPISSKFIENTYYISGYDLTTLKGYLFSTKDFGLTWNIEIEYIKKLYSIQQHGNRILLLSEDGSVYSKETQLNVNNKIEKNCQKTQELDYYDLLGNILEDNNIYNKQIIVRYKCLETGEITHKLEIRER